MDPFSLKFAVIGILLVFGALAFITFAITVTRRLDAKWESREEKEERSALDKDQSIDTTTLVLIAAAAATMIQGRFHIRRVRRLMPTHSESGPWSKQGRAILHGSHVVPRKR